MIQRRNNAESNDAMLLRLINSYYKIAALMADAKALIPQ
jgi:hypothetical protein